MIAKLKGDINQILSDWNPLGVDDSIALIEYKSYIPDILNSSTEISRLWIFLEHLLLDKMEVEYDRSNKDHLSDLQNVCEKIMAAVKDNI
jgi:hypothetical protein